MVLNYDQYIEETQIKKQAMLSIIKLADKIDLIEILFEVYNKTDKR